MKPSDAARGNHSLQILRHTLVIVYDRSSLLSKKVWGADNT